MPTLAYADDRIYLKVKFFGGTKDQGGSIARNSVWELRLHRFSTTIWARARGSRTTYYLGDTNDLLIETQ